MKVAVILCAVLALGFAAPRQSKPFHEHFEEFLDIIMQESGDALNELRDQYLGSEDFWMAANYMKSADFKSLVYEMEALPEFNAVVEFLENDNIDILYFIDLFNAALEQAVPKKRQEASGQDLSSYIRDSIALFPKAQLAALFDKKMEEDADFRTAIENLQGPEWEAIWDAMWANETFQVEVQILLDNGIDIRVFLDELMAIFGQK